MTESIQSNPTEFAAVFSEIEASLTRLKNDRQRLMAERDAERENSLRLTSELEQSKAEVRDVQQTAAQERARVDRLKTALADTERHIHEMVEVSERQLIDLQVRHDAAIEEWQTRFQRSGDSHEREMNRIEREKAELAREIEALRVELQSVRSRPVDLSSIGERLGRPGSVLVVDGEPLAIMAWPSTPADARRHRLLSRLERYCVDTRSVADVVFDDPAGTEAAAESSSVRVRIPHRGLPADAALRRLEQTYVESGHPVSVVTSRVGSPNQVSTSIFATHVGITATATPPAGTSERSSGQHPVRPSPNHGESARPAAPPSLPQTAEEPAAQTIIEAHLGMRES